MRAVTVIVHRRIQANDTESVWITNVFKGTKKIEEQVSWGGYSLTLNGDLSGMKIREKKGKGLIEDLGRVRNVTRDNLIGRIQASFMLL